MSDFEYECTGTNASDEDNISYDFNISDNDYNYDSDSDSEHISDNKDETVCNSTIKTIKKVQYIIDMDDDQEKDLKNKDQKLSTEPSKLQPLKLKLKTQKKLNSTPIINTFSTMFEPEIKDTEQIADKTKINIKDKKGTKETKGTKEIKLTKKEQSFEYNQETIEYFTQDLDFKKILIKNSPFTNDIQVICLLLKYKVITDYCCSVKKCKVKLVWNDIPIQLILHRKNNIQNDLTICNLELICGNCYLCMYGLDIFKKKEKEIILLCNICNFPLVKFNNNRKKKGICLACEKKMNRVFNENIETQFYTNMQGLYNNNPLLSEDRKQSNYYKDISKYKATSSSSKPSGNIINSSKEGIAKPIIKLNMKTPNMDDLLKD